MSRLNRLSLWGAVRRYAERKERSAWMDAYNFDNKCPHCLRWQANCGGVKAVQGSYPDDWHDAFVCGGCEQWFLMDSRGMIAEVAADQRPALALPAFGQHYGRCPDELKAEVAP